ncbi:MAG: hypothetical protein K9N51_11065 [Candidatus Pacebacteria bacterium]|nr:hypothetical protein [Candidatus Paceibacterota bacterium]
MSLINEALKQAGNHTRSSNVQFGGNRGMAPAPRHRSSIIAGILAVGGIVVALMLVGIVVGGVLLLIGRQDKTASSTDTTSVAGVPDSAPATHQAGTDVASEPVPPAEPAHTNPTSPENVNAATSPSETGEGIPAETTRTTSAQPTEPIVQTEVVAHDDTLRSTSSSEATAPLEAAPGKPAPSLLLTKLRPKAPLAPAHVRETFKVQGIMKGSNGYSALVNNELVHPGEELSDGTVIAEITAKYVILDFGKARYRVKLQ